MSSESASHESAAATASSTTSAFWCSPGARGMTSGLEIGQTGERAAMLSHLRGGAVRTLVVYATSDSALADLGSLARAAPPMRPNRVTEAISAESKALCGTLRAATD